MNSKPEVKIVLNMIVKNEAHVMRRVLDNVCHMVDYIVIEDTGSDDNTVQIIEDFLKEKKIPGEVTHYKWTEDFGKNRTSALRSAEKFLDRLIAKEASKGKGDKTKIEGPVAEDDWKEVKEAKHKNSYYIMFMDADNMCYPDPGKGTKFTFDKSKLTEDSYAVDMTQGSIRYDYLWMIKYDPEGKRKWKWYCPLHEYCATEGGWT